MRAFVLQGQPKNSTYEAFLQTLYNVCLMIPALDMEEGDLQCLLKELKENSLIDNAKGYRLEERWRDLSSVTAIYSLFCIFEAQPKRPYVLVRIQEQHYDGFRGACDLKSLDMIW